ncbi:MAG: Stage 0 sporulation protein J [Parcubacteria group bacterium GW2011_GWA2_36_10]|nr:MAG: Stage 0 sporulation protein J [Parcubacteria group bacterium GW2011_GWA2_36_10]
MSEVPVIVRLASDKDKLELSIIENVQRHNLNPLEEAESYRRLEEEFGLTREQISEQVGRSAATVAQYLRILKLPIVIQEALRDNQITFSHAKAIVGYPSKLEQIKIFKKILDSNLSVHQLEDLGKKKADKIKEEAAKDPILTSWEDRLSRNLGAKVKIMKHADKGSIKIDFFSHEELRNILEKLS